MTLIEVANLPVGTTSAWSRMVSQLKSAAVKVVEGMIVPMLCMRVGGFLMH